MMMPAAKRAAMQSAASGSLARWGRSLRQAKLGKSERTERPAGLRRVLGSIRVRLAGLVLIVAIPLILLSATIVWQNYRMALGTSGLMAVRLRASAVARQAAAVGGAEQMMQALAQVDEIFTGDIGACRNRLIGVLSLQLQRYSNLAAFDAAGHWRCSAADLPSAPPAATLEQANRPLLDQASRGTSFAFGAVRRSLRTSGWVIPLIYPVRSAGRVRGFLYAGLRTDGLSEAHGAGLPELAAVWLAGPGGSLTQVGATGPAGLPQAASLEELLAGDRTIDAQSTGGAPYAYASADIGDGYRILVASPAAADRAAAHDLLVKRIVQLTLLLMLGLAAVAVGAHVALVEPLDQLARAVARWRHGGGFDPSGIDDPPTEIRELAATFGSATRALAEHEDRQRKAVEQQDLLMKEIHHRVKNNLQIVASLLNLQASRIRAPEAKAEFASARDRVRALATLHRHLYVEGEMHSINMRSFLTELCGQLFQAMGEREGKRITLNIEATELQMSSDQAVPLSLIVTEAVSNALKYAFPNGRKGHVDVRLTSDAEVAELVVCDNGIGIPAGKAETDMGPRDGIGITLIRGFARQLGGDLTVEEKDGTSYCLRMRLHRRYEPESAALEALPA